MNDGKKVRGFFTLLITQSQRNINKIKSSRRN